MRDSDMALFARWVRTPEVAKWWYEEAAMDDEELAKNMSPSVLAGENVSPFIFSLDGEDAGYIQTYRIGDWPEALEMFGIPGAVGVDLFIGEERWRHRGYGAGLLREFIDQYVFSNDDVSTCVIDPDVRNVIAIKAYEKAGFNRVRDVVSPEDNLTYTMMRLDRK